MQMTRMAVYLLMTVLMAVYGGYTVLKSLQAVRKPRKYPDALMYWDERPSGLQGDDLMSWLGVNIHRLALVCIAAISVLVFVRDARGATEPFAAGWDSGFLASVVAYFTAALTAFFGGFTLFGPVAEFMGGNRHYAASESGLLLAGQHFPWD